MTRTPPSTTAPVRPSGWYSSSVRACTASARDVVPGSAALSMMRTRTPRRARQSARTRPVGPAPTMRTGRRPPRTLLGLAEYLEFERFSTTVLNAYLQPLMDGYLGGLEERLRATGYAHGVLTVASSGGMMTAETARRLPIKTVFSGPAGGVSQACFVGAASGVRDFITYDMGGTSTDVCLVHGLTPVMTADSMIGAFP